MLLLGNTDLFELNGLTWKPITKFAGGEGWRAMHVPTLHGVALTGTDQTWTYKNGALELLSEKFPDSAQHAEHATAYVPDMSKLILFGGSTKSTLGFAGGTWSLLSIMGPQQRTDTDMAYDPATKKVVMFGGKSAGAALGDTWEWYDQGGSWNWHVTTPNPAPGARFGHRLARSQQAGGLILFGGTDGSQLFGDTWKYDPATSTWTQLSQTVCHEAGRDAGIPDAGTDDAGAPDAGSSPSTPCALYSHGIDTNAVDGRPYLFGGQGDLGSVGELWRFNGADWEQVCTASPCLDTTPSPRFGPAWTYDPENKAFFLFAGSNSDTYGNHTPQQDVWSYGTRLGFPGIVMAWDAAMVSVPTEISLTVIAAGESPDAGGVMQHGVGMFLWDVQGKTWVPAGTNTADPDAYNQSAWTIERTFTPGAPNDLVRYVNDPGFEGRIYVLVRTLNKSSQLGGARLIMDYTKARVKWTR